ncbi:MAG: hypothetical protein AAF631_01305 [Pseudomonadota bacterium]
MNALEAAALIEAGYDGDLGSAARVKPAQDGAEAFLMQDGTLVIPGTNQLRDWRRYNLRVYSLRAVRSTGSYRFHSGFLIHANRVLHWVKTKPVKRITGHSLGAASGQILAAILDVPAINFAAPKVALGTAAYRGEARIININRRDDRVAHVPRLAFRHLGHVAWMVDPKRNIGGDHEIGEYVDLLQLPQYQSLARTRT